MGGCTASGGWLACDNLLSARAVLASGGLVTASAEKHPDQFWALQCGGGNFGVVVDCTFQAHEVGPGVALAAVLAIVRFGAVAAIPGGHTAILASLALRVRHS